MGSEIGPMAQSYGSIPCAVRPDRVEILGVLGAGCAAARFFLLPTIAVGLKKISFEWGIDPVAARGKREKSGRW